MRTMFRRFLLLATILAASLTLSGCSYFAEFVLVNKSAKTLVVEYFMKPTEAIVFPHVKARLASLHQHEANWLEFNAFPEDRLWVSADRQSARVVLLPDEVLFLASHDIRDVANEPIFKSGIAKLSISTDSGSLTYEGDQVFKQFVPSQSGVFPGEPALYTITIQE